MDIKSQTPAKGVLLVNDWGQSKMYKAVCECGDDDCTHTIDVEAEDHGITVTIYTTTRTNFWSKTRWKQLWNLLIKGHTDFETCIVMDKQTALNYSQVLQTAVEDVESFRKSKKK